MAMSFKDVKKKLKEILKPSRYQHVVRVSETGIKINKDLNLGLDEDKIKYACLLHDCAKGNEEKYFDELKDKYNLNKDEVFELFVVSHAILGSYVAKEFYGIEDKEILEAIRWHTTGKENMTMLEKLVFIADYIEPGRDFKDVKIIREEIYKDFDKAILLSLDLQIKYIIKKHDIIGLETIKARNYLQRRVDE